MKKSKRIFAVLVLAFCAFLTSCHGKSSSPSFDMPQEFDEQKSYEITFWAKNDTNKAQVQAYHNAVSSFESLYPNIKINIRLYTDYGSIYNDVITNIATDTTPNVCITYPDHIATYLEGKDVIVPLDELINDSSYGLGGKLLRFDSPKKEEIVPQYLNEGHFGGAQYALPFMRSTEACYVNKTLVERLGYTLPQTLTWDFVWEVSQKAAESNSDGTNKLNGQKVMIPFIYKSTDNMMIQMLKQRQAGYSDSDGSISLFNEVTEEILQTVAKNTSMGAFSTFKISGYPANFLNAGQCVFAIDSTAGASWMGSNAPNCDISEENLVDFETAVMTIPQFDANNPKMISQGPSVCLFNKKDSGEVLASWLFMQFLLTNEVQLAYCQTEGYAPVTTKAQQSEEYQNYLGKSGTDNELYYDIKIEATRLLLSNIDNTFVTPVFNGSASLRDASGQLIESVTKSVRRKTAIDRAYLDKLYSDTASLYHLDSISTNGKKAELGSLPTASRILIYSLCFIWLVILSFAAVQFIKSRAATKD